MRWFSSDALTDGFVTSLSIQEEGCYRRLLDFNAVDGHIPDDVPRLARMCKLTEKEFKPIWKVIAEKFDSVNGHPNLLTNSRIKFELSRQRKLSKIKADNRKGLQATPFKPDGRGTSVSRMRIDPDPDSDPASITKKEGEGLDQGALFDAERRKKSPKRPDIIWDSKKENFYGIDLAALKKRLQERYFNEFGRRWLNSEWGKMCEWCADNQETIQAKKSVRAFILNWFRKSAGDRRERGR